MKKAIVLSICIINCIICLGQNNTQLNNTTSIDLPNEFEKITRDQGLEHLQQRFKITKMLSESFLMGSSQYLYKIGNVIVNLHPDDQHIPAEPLPALKKGIDALYGENKTYTSGIKKINNNSVFIINYMFNDIYYYYFFARNSNSTKSVNGTFAFEGNDAKKAETLLHHLLKSITFKE